MGVALFVLVGLRRAVVVARVPTIAAAPAACAGSALAAFFLGAGGGLEVPGADLPAAGGAVRDPARAPAQGLGAGARLCFLLPCIYWYARNAVMTGDPFNPIGARLFGFTNWNAADYKHQFDDVRAPCRPGPTACCGPCCSRRSALVWKRSPAVRAAGWFCAVLAGRLGRDLALSALPDRLVAADRADGGGRLAGACWAACVARAALRRGAARMRTRAAWLDRAGALASACCCWLLGVGGCVLP